MIRWVDSSSPSADRRKDGDLAGAARERRLESAQVADVVRAHEDIDVRADLALLGQDPVLEARVKRPEGFEGLGDGPPRGRRAGRGPGRRRAGAAARES